MDKGKWELMVIFLFFQMQMTSPFGAPQMMRPMAFSPQTAALLGQNMMRHGPPGMPPGRDYY